MRAALTNLSYVAPNDFEGDGLMKARLEVFRLLGWIGEVGWVGLCWLVG